MADINIVTTTLVKKSDYDRAHSILVQQSGTGTPEIVTLSNSELLGKDGSEIKGYSASEIRTLINVENGANVTNTTNVTAAGALMDSEVVNLEQVKAFDSDDYATSAQGALADSAIQSGDNVSELVNDANYITETNVTGTSRQYTKGQAMTNVALTINTGEIALDLTLGNSFTLVLDADAELQLPTVDRPQSVQIRVFNDGGNTLTFATGYKVLGDESTTTDTEYCLINIACFGDNTPWLTCNNQPA
jgi:hypothetical protein